jgi:site-specific DNA-adenine methylase
MFSYYGGKSKIIIHYPKPIYDIIVEPFAGSACYSYNYGLDKKVMPNDNYDVIYDIWRYLLQASEEDIKKLPELKRGDDIRKFNLSKEEKLLLGFCVNNGASKPCNIVTEYADKTAYPKTDSRWRPHTTWQLTRKRILDKLPYIKKWEISNLNYLDLPNIEATWFIDPPYQFGGKYYAKNNINYRELAEWCKSRKGQVIVCENSKANWLPFKPLIELQGQKHRTSEVIWQNN